jgi:tRNA (guanosine-2'-O-)-methyltransferase
MSKTLSKTKVKQLNKMAAAELNSADLVFLLQDVNDPVNVGSLFRTADAVGASLLLTGTTPQPPHSGISMTSRGLERSVSWEYVKDVDQAISTLKSQGYDVVGVEIAESAVPYFQYQFKAKTCLVLGNEALGIYKKVLPLCDAIVSIPMLGKGQSLNVQIAGAIVGYEVLNKQN